MAVARKPLRVLLVRPKAANMLGYLNVVDVEPLELEYLYTVFRDAGFEAVIYDALLDRATLSDVLRRERPDVLCITGYIAQQALMLSSHGSLQAPSVQALRHAQDRLRLSEPVPVLLLPHVEPVALQRARHAPRDGRARREAAPRMIEGVTFCNQNMANLQVIGKPAARLRRE